ncbi:DUF2986 domain-containing protein [Vibrio sp. V27_P1S3P104]|uniref:DUF2986 domain-containing protein n=1 Tax=Vibrio TaxID=662 RepID=UPI000C16F967|nr:MULTISPECIES: DUF2986 domain-containing protein [Vibrio]NAW69101.1 DUF2986 domain-containing protein [Vibrio sp. V28_P6S34P95]NAX06342.1 DUF2986 domain-containing protein [Vibrio sp. V30_P3S12P165]NAX34355.1 DUF2986 domain-containing protein [Vibrio sp. V29_P1S30P107]NAX36066.1 DUF2986 domain-containing protein [Vibrio sp. V27_P1S3P104]NAX41201.1 DUF2986 domain-containing protein [Vibrio sp. V26_P1S5P106]
MNRKKRINQILKSKQKKQNAKLHKSGKPRYIAKAEREQTALSPSDEIEGQETSLTDLERS